MQFLFNLPVTYEPNCLEEQGIAWLNPLYDEYELNWIGLLTQGFVVSTIQWNDDDNCYPSVWTDISGTT